MENFTEGGYFISTELEAGHVHSYYTLSPIASVDFRKNSGDTVDVLVTGKDGRSWQWSSESLFLAGHMMYGISISRDGRFLFAQKSFGGMDCLELTTGKLVWKLKARADIGRIYVGQDCICCSKSRNLLILVDIQSGALLQEYRTPFSNLFDILDDAHILIHSHAAYWEVLDGNTLKQVTKIPDKALHLNHASILRELYHHYAGSEADN